MSVLINREYTALSRHYTHEIIERPYRLKGVQYTALHAAAYNANYSVCRLLIDSNANVDAKDYRSTRNFVFAFKNAILIFGFAFY
jgi:hypothetical protein